MVDFEVDTLSTLISKNKHVKQSLIDILGESSDSDTRLKAGSHLRMIHSSQFIVALVVTQYILSNTRHLSQALHKADCDTVKACIDANTFKKVIREQREVNTFRNLWGKIEALADYVDVVIAKPRTARRLARRSIAGEIDDTAMQYFKVNVFFPFIDHCLMKLDQRFPVDKTDMFLTAKFMPLTKLQQ